MAKNRIWITLFLLPALIIFACIFAWPMILVVSSSFFEWKGLSGHMTFVGLENYIQMFTGDRIFNRAFWNTLIWVLLQSTVHVALGTTVAIILSKKPFGWQAVRSIYMFPNIISLSVLGMVYLNLFNPRIGIVNVLIRMLPGMESFNQNWYFDNATAFGTVTFTWLVFAGLVTILVLAEIMSISPDIYEAAKIDGAGGFQIDRYITLPLLRNILGTSVILSATSMLKEFELIYLTTNGGPDIATMNLPLYIYKTSLIENNYGYANAVSTITIIAGILIIVFANRLFRMEQSDNA